LDDKDYRRRILTQLNRGESENGLKRIGVYGKKGEIHQPHREGQEDQLNSLGLVTNAVILWNTVYMQKALDTIRNAGYPVNHDDVKRLSPLGYDHINIVEHYSFNLPDELLNYLVKYRCSNGIFCPVTTQPPILVQLVIVI
jgi:hypothetical protein